MSAPQWTPEMEDVLLDMWNRGKTSGAIACRIKRSRSAVIGKLHRLGLIPSGRASAAAAEARKRAAEKVRRKAVIHKLVPSNRAKWRPAGPMPDSDEGRTDLIPLAELTNRTCRWPVGHPKEPGFGFCGRHSLDGESYCAEHHVRAHEQPAQQERQAA